MQASSLAGAYTGCILKGEKPAVVPVLLVAKVELATKPGTAEVISGLRCQPSPFAAADEVRNR